MSDINITVQDEIVNIDILDEPVLVNVVNSPGVPGAPGQGVPVGGTTGQVLAKNSNTNYDTEWVDVTGGVWGSITGTLSDQTDLQSALDAKFDEPTGDTTQYIAGDGSLVAFPITGQAGTLVREVRNVTGATLTKGTVCYINGASGNKPTVAKAIATGDATSAQTFGLIQANIPNNSNGYLVAFGDLDGLNTSAFAEGVQLYLSSTTAGEYTSVKQYAPNHLVYIGVVTRQHVNQGSIEVRIQNGYEMDELHDVAAQTPSSNDGLFYNTSTSLWENKSIATALGYTPANAATTLTINGVTYDLSTSRTFTVGSVTGSGASGQVAYWNGTSSQTGSNNLFWDAANSWLGIGTNTYISNTRATISENFTAQASIALRLKGVGSSTGVWKGRVVAGGDTVAFLMGEYNSQAWLGGHNAALNAWSPLYINPDGTTDLYLGDFGSGGSNVVVPIMTLRNSTGNTLIGGTFTDGGQRLQVSGTTLLNGNVTFSSSTGMFWDATNSRLGIGTNAPSAALQVTSDITVNGVQIGKGGGSISTNTRLGVSALNSNTSGDFNTAIGNTSAFSNTTGARNVSIGHECFYSNTTGFWNTAIGMASMYFNISGSQNVALGYRSLQTNTGSNNTAIGSNAGRLHDTGSNNIFIGSNSIGVSVSESNRTWIGNTDTSSTWLGGNLLLGSTTSTGERLQVTGTGVIKDIVTSSVASALFQLSSTTKGFLPPRMTTTQKNAISSPAAGLVVYDTTLAKLCVYTTAWETITSV
jgi:hypothetical protein